MTLAEKNILLGVTGGIAAYKAPILVRHLRNEGANVQVVFSRSAHEFVAPVTMQALSGRPVRDDLWDREAEAAMGHIELARWADLVLVAPATAHFMACLARGLAPDLLTTLCLATNAPILLAPAMNQAMWRDPATRRNATILAEDGRAHHRPRGWRPSLRRHRAGPHGGTRGVAVGRATNPGGTLPKGPQGAGDGRPHPGSAGPGALPFQPELRQARLRHRPSRRCRRRPNHPCLRPEQPAGSGERGAH